MMRAGRMAVAAVVALLAAGAAEAQAPRTERLDNGFTVIVRENPLAPVVAVDLLVKTGTRWEQPANAGISNFLHAVMVKGTTKRSGAKIAEEVAAMGGKISAAGEIDYSNIRSAALARFWKPLLALTAELALSPALAPEEVTGERDWLLSRIQRRRDNAPSRAFDELYAALYGPHPYAIPTLGTPASLARIDHAALVAHYRAAYRPERLVLAVSGQVSADEVIAEVRRLFGGMPAGGVATDPRLSAPVPAGRRIVIEQPAQQTQIVVGAIAPSLDQPDHAAVKVLSTVLGGGMAGRLFVELRDRRGLAYTATSFYEPMKEPGALILYLGTAPENAAKAEDGLRQEIERVRKERVGEDEIRRAKNYLLGRSEMDRRTNERQAWYLGFYTVQGVGLDFPARYRRTIDAVTAADVLRAAQTYLATLTTIVLEPPRTR
ncbi:MAG TPA: pitrilysin family protein [Methylomirabilota bacterium]|jgi:predicted Zn-dependent peptidase|nr:pitrilysin family protein [Methylomirabilota bacterium]